VVMTEIPGWLSTEIRKGMECLQKIPIFAYRDSQGQRVLA